MVDSRDKGARGERKALKLLEKWWGSDFAKTPSSGGFKTKKFRQEWNSEGDIVTPDKTFPFAVEVKWWEGWSLDQILTAPKTSIWSWWEQAKRETSEGRFTLLVFKKNRQDFFMMTKEEEKHTPYQAEFTKSARIRVLDRQEGFVYVRLFKDLLKEPTELWARKLRKS
jgi:hypothetical protein